jgi:hypothetical protein
VQRLLIGEPLLQLVLTAAGTVQSGMFATAYLRCLLDGSLLMLPSKLPPASVPSPAPRCGAPPVLHHCGQLPMRSAALLSLPSACHAAQCRRHLWVLEAEPRLLQKQTDNTSEHQHCHVAVVAMQLLVQALRKQAQYLPTQPDSAGPMPCKLLAQDLHACCHLSIERQLLTTNNRPWAPALFNMQKRTDERIRQCTLIW